MYKKQLLVVVEGDALRRLYASHHGGFTVAVAMTSSEEKKDYPPQNAIVYPTAPQSFIRSREHS